MRLDAHNTNGRAGIDVTRAAIRDVAVRAGVSVATVSRVLNDRPDVSPSTRAAVQRHMKELGYVGNRRARALASGRTGLVGLTVPYMTDDYFAALMMGAAEALYERDARLVVCPTLHEHDREVSLLDHLKQGLTDGGLLVAPSESGAELAALYRQGYPFVVIDSGVPLAEGIPVVAAANWAGARTATEHLIALGHRRIAALTGPPSWSANVDRLAGYHSALVAAGLPIVPEMVRDADFAIDGGYKAAQHLLSLADRPTAIFAFNDKMAFGALRAARERGLDIPGHLSVVGFDDIELASLVTPELTTIRQPLKEMGRVAASVLYRLLDGQPLDATRVELSTKLVTRASTGSPP